MKIPFKSGKENLVSDEIVQKILSQSDRLSVLMEIAYKLPTELVMWFEGWLKSETSSKNYVEVDISSTVNAPIILTGDLVIKKHTNPKPKDIVQLNYRLPESSDYDSRLCKVLSVDFKKSTLTVEDIIDPKISWTPGVNNVLYIIDKVIPYGTDEWKKLVQILNIEYNNSEIKAWITKSIEFIEKAEKFYEQEKTLKGLKERLELANQND